MIERARVLGNVAWMSRTRLLATVLCPVVALLAFVLSASASAWIISVPKFYCVTDDSGRTCAGPPTQPVSPKQVGDNLNFGCLSLKKGGVTLRVRLSHEGRTLLDRTMKCRHRGQGDPRKRIFSGFPEAGVYRVTFNGGNLHNVVRYIRVLPEGQPSQAPKTAGVSE